MGKHHHKCKRVINSLDRICPVCSELVSEHEPIIHHVEVYPSIGVYIHEDCHFRVHHEERFAYLRPMMSHQQVDVAHKMIKNREKIKKLIALNNEVSKLHRKIKM